MIRSRETLVLTLIGGGVFSNPINEILKAMAQAHVKFAQLGLLKNVLLPLYEAPARAKSIAEEAVVALVASGCPRDKIKIVFY